MSEQKTQKFDVNAMLPESLRGKMIGGEKVTGILAGLLIVGGIGLGLWWLLPPLVIIMKNLVLFGALCLAAGTMVAAVAHPGFRNMIGTTYAVWVRKLHNKIISKSPYDWARFIIQRSKEFIQSAMERLGKLRGANMRLTKLIEKNGLNMQDRIDRANAAKGMGKDAQHDAQLRIVGQIKASNERLTKQLAFQQQLTELLQKSLENGQLKIEEEEAQIELAIEENSAMIEAQGVASDVIAAIQRDPQSAQNLNTAMNAIAMSTALKLGQIEQIMTDIRPVMEDMELGKAVSLERGKRVLEELEAKNNRLQLAGVGQRISIPETEAEPEMVTVGNRRASSDFRSLLDKNKQ